MLLSELDRRFRSFRNLSASCDILAIAHCVENEDVHPGAPGTRNSMLSSV